MSEILEEYNIPKKGMLIDKTHLLERELLAQKGVITKNGKEYFSTGKRNSDGSTIYDYHDVIYIYIPWPRSIFNWFGRKHCGTINVDKQTILIFRNYNECHNLLKKMPYFDKYDLEITSG